MILNVFIAPDVEQRLRKHAEIAGVDLETYASQLLERLSASPRTLLELSGPAFEEFLNSGMTDDELGDFLEKVKHEMRAEKRRRQAS